MDYWKDFTGQCLNYVGILIMAGAIVLLLILCIISLYKWYKWKHNYNIESSFVDALEIQIKNDTKKHEETVGELADRLSNSFNDKNELKEQLDISKNTVASLKSKLEKINPRITAWELTMKFCPKFTELDEVHDKIWKDIKTS